MSALAASFGPSASPLPVTPKKKKLATPEPTPKKTVARKKPAAVEPVAEPVPEPKAEVVEPPAKKVKKAKVEAEAEVVAPAAAEKVEVPAATGGKVKKTAKKEAEPKKAAKKEEKADKGPKRALAAFMFYSNSVRAQTRLDNPTLKITEIASLLGKQWAELSEDAKKPYVAMHEKDKKRYDEEKAAAAAK